MHHSSNPFGIIIILAFALGLSACQSMQTSTIKPTASIAIGTTAR